MTNLEFGRRTFLASATAAITATSLQFPMAGSTRAAQGTDASSLAFGDLKQVRAGVLNVGYYDTGPADGQVVVLLHGFPYDVQSYIEVAPSLIGQGFRVLVPYLRGHGTTTFADKSTPRSGEQAALGKDLVDFLNALGVERAIFAGYDWGGRAGCVAAALWPDRCSGLVSVNGYLIQDIANAGKPAPARVERGFWYQFYFQTERGRAGLHANRRDIARIMWRENSPTWQFDEVTFERSAKSFDNPDYVDVVIHSYRHRLGGASGYPDYEALQSQLAAQPMIAVPSVTLDGDADGVVTATDGKAQASRFSAERVHHIIAGVGHNLPQEAPSAFVDAITEVSSMA
ncbi:alpha/beta fold hydrolase [Endobacterium cereale]|uniref:alpha/beta fold hydrolase n=1 Tax=Endobacterium cereale TaxID=2663029 RepID=UPI002B482B54|nr:alpha/beta hydrolase [Endobacterium cereale]MEB2848071.1 alpha/beta hydrolase [Endobacterium cereale]